MNSIKLVCQKNKPGVVKLQQKTEGATRFRPRVNNCNTERMIWFLEMFTLCI